MNDKLRVILVSPYSDHLVGGIINWTKYIVNYHREYDESVDLHLLNNENAVQVMDATGLVTRLINGLSNYIPVYRQFKKKIVEEHFDVVHICTSASFGLIRDLLIVNAARKKGVKTAVHMHFGRIPKILKSSGWENRLLLSLMKRIDIAVVMDKASLEALQNAGFKNVCFLPNPLSKEVNDIILRQGDLQREPRKIIFAGHVLETKGVFELVKACSNIPNIRVIIIGKITSDEIIGQIMKLGGDSADQWLCLTGNKPFEEVIREMKTCAIFALPSYSEGFPNVILESMACGCAIVATPVGAIAEMLDIKGEHPCGICVPVKSVDALHHAIIELLENQDKALRLGENARHRVNEMYAIPRVWEQLIEIWRGIAINENDF